MWLNNILETIGNTPLIKLNKITKDLPATVLAKVDYFNPGNSIKDRMALKMVEVAEKEGKLKPGGTIIEEGVTLWGQVGVSKTLTIGANAVVLAQSGVPSSLAGGKTYFGYPAEDASIKRRELVWIKRIPEMWKKIME